MQTPCPQCGALNRPQARFCAVCRQPLTTLPPVPSHSPPTTLMPAGGGSRLVASNGQTYMLQLPTLTIGREGDVSLPDHMASRQHARLEQTPAGWQITDLGSSNGTFVNAQRLTPHQPRPLQPGDQIVVGSTTLAFDPPSGGTPAPARSAAPTQLYDPSFSPLQPFSPSTPPVQWRTWSNQPQVEGHVDYIDATPHMERKSILGKVAVASAIAIVAPRFLFLPFVDRNEVAVLNVRVRDRQTDQQVAVRIKGDLIGSINTGDDVAVWAKVDKGGVLEMVRAYNYTTGQDLRVK